MKTMIRIILKTVIRLEKLWNDKSVAERVFSPLFQKVMISLYGLMTVIFIVMIWTNVVVIP